MNHGKRTGQLTALIFASSLVAAVGCASKHNRAEVVKRTEVTETTHHAANNATSATPNAEMSAQPAATSQADRNLVSTIDFEPGRKGLSPEATAELNRVIMEAKQKGEVQQVNVAVWSDSEATATQGRILPSQQVNLAQQRGKNIEKYIDRMEPAADVHVVNMAQKPTAFVNFIQSEDPSVKEKLSAMGMATDENSKEIKGRSSSAVVVIKVR
jgi:hypothetical protein